LLELLKEGKITVPEFLAIIAHEIAHLENADIETSLRMVSSGSEEKLAETITKIEIDNWVRAAELLSDAGLSYKAATSALEKLKNGEFDVLWDKIEGENSIRGKLKELPIPQISSLAIDAINRHKIWPVQTLTFGFGSVTQPTSSKVETPSAAAETPVLGKVSEASKKFNVTFVSSISATFDNAHNLKSKKGRSWKEKILEIKDNPEAIICGSTVKPGDRTGNLYYPFGVVIGEGDVVGASAGDAGSVVLEDGRRVSNGPTQSISEAISNRGDYGNNELHIVNSRIAGLYIVDENIGSSC